MPRFYAFLWIGYLRRLPALVQKTGQYLEGLNLFPSSTPLANPDLLYLQRLSTRMFILLLSVSIYTLLIYVSSDNVTKTVNVVNPSAHRFEKLYQNYSQTLACPCTKISTKYEEFVNITFSMHAAVRQYVRNRGMDQIHRRSKLSRFVD